MTTKNPSILLAGAAALALAACSATGAEPAPETAAAGTWSLEADVAEACCCDPICPCMVGSPATRGHCEGTRLIAVREGRFGDVRLDGVVVLASFRMGEWVRLFVGDGATAAQAEAVAPLVAAAFPSFGRWGIVATERVPVAVERTDSACSFTCADAEVAMDVMTGADGAPIRVENLASFPGYVQHRSRVNRYAGPEGSFEYSGTSGFTARYSGGG